MTEANERKLTAYKRQVPETANDSATQIYKCIDRFPRLWQYDFEVDAVASPCRHCRVDSPTLTLYHCHHCCCLCRDSKNTAVHDLLPRPLLLQNPRYQHQHSWSVYLSSRLRSYRSQPQRPPAVSAVYPDGRHRTRRDSVPPPTTPIGDLPIAATPTSRINRGRCTVCGIVSIPAAECELARSECQWGNVTVGSLLFSERDSEWSEVHHHVYKI